MSGAAKLPFFNRRAMAAMMNLPEEAVDYVEYDVGGGFGARGEFYPEDFLVALRGPQLRPAGEMGRGPPRAFHGDRPFARDRMRSRDRARPRRHDPRPARRHLGRHRRLCAAERHDAGAQCRAVHHRTLSRAEPASEVARDGHQQDAVRHLSRAGAFRGLLLHGAADRHGGRRPGRRPARNPAPQPHRAR